MASLTTAVDHRRSHESVFRIVRQSEDLKSVIIMRQTILFVSLVLQAATGFRMPMHSQVVPLFLSNTFCISHVSMSIKLNTVVTVNQKGEIDKLDMLPVQFL